MCRCILYYIYIYIILYILYYYIIYIYIYIYMYSDIFWLNLMSAVNGKNLLPLNHLRAAVEAAEVMTITWERGLWTGWKTTGNKQGEKIAVTLPWIPLRFVFTMMFHDVPCVFLTWTLWLHSFLGDPSKTSTHVVPATEDFDGASR